MTEKRVDRPKMEKKGGKQLCRGEVSNRKD